LFAIILRMGPLGQRRPSWQRQIASRAGQEAAEVGRRPREEVKNMLLCMHAGAPLPAPLCRII